MLMKGKQRMSSYVDEHQVKNPELKQGCASSSFKKLLKAKVWLARAKDVFLVFYRSWCLVGRPDC